MKINYFSCNSFLAFLENKIDIYKIFPASFIKFGHFRENDFIKLLPVAQFCGPFSI